jgi:hypothetical protein
MTKKTTTKRGKRPQLQASVDPTILARIKAEADANFDSVSAIVEARLVASYANEVSLPKTALADTKERSAEVDLQLKELRLKQLRKEVLTVDAALCVVRRVFGEMRTEGLAMMQDLARHYNLDTAECERRFLIAMAGQFAVQREPYQQAANEFSKEALP